MAAAARVKGNRLLNALLPADLALLQPHLEFRKLAVRDEFEKPNRRIDRIAFVETGIISVVSELPDNTRIEIGLIGCEGMSGTAVSLGDDRSVHSTYVQVAGTAQCISALAFRDALNQSDSLLSIALKYVQSFILQTSHTAIANARANITTRLARWLLMANDRLSDDELPLTHEFLSLMLGVRRAGVTEAIKALVKRKVVTADRGRLVLTDRKGLEKIAGNFYGIPEDQYRRLMR